MLYMLLENAGHSHLTFLPEEAETWSQKQLRIDLKIFLVSSNRCGSKLVEANFLNTANIFSFNQLLFALQVYFKPLASSASQLICLSSNILTMICYYFQSVDILLRKLAQQISW